MILAAALLLAACGGGGTSGGEDGATSTTTGGATTAGATTTGSTAAAATTTPAAPPPVATMQGVALTATKVADTQMLTSIAWRRGDPDPYLADQYGTVYHLVDGTATPVLDLTANVLDYEQGAEYGLLGMTFDPRNGRLIVGYNGNDVDTRIESYAVGEDGAVDPSSAWEIIRIEQPGVGHNSGHLAFARDNTMYVSMGDGGGSNGADAQNMTKLLGGILRISPNTDGPGYTVPDDNPFVGRDGFAPELWAKGMRNPWRFSIDHATGDLWVGDVGETTWEAVYHFPNGQAAGTNCGWPTFEGGHQVNINSAVRVPEAWVTRPVHSYRHSEVGPAVIGGYVYRGSAIPQLQGAYVFMDMVGPMFAMGADGVVRLDVEIGGIQTSFGEGPDGELYVLTHLNGAFKLGPG